MNLNLTRKITLSFICSLFLTFTHYETLALTVTKQFNWEYQGKNLSIDLNLDTRNYSYYKGIPKYYVEEKYAEEVSGYQYLGQLANTFRAKAQSNGWYGINERNMVIAFVQEAIPYATDPPNHGYDYPRYPIETLYDGQGDCEDKAALLAALLKTLGYDCILLEVPTHVFVGLACPDVYTPKTGYYNINGKRYVYLESTLKWPIGKPIPEVSGNLNANLINVRQVAVCTIDPHPHNNYALKDQPNTVPVYHNQTPAPEPKPNPINSNSQTFNNMNVTSTINCNNCWAGVYISTSVIVNGQTIISQTYSSGSTTITTNNYRQP